MLSRVEDYKIFDYYVYERPYLIQFLNQVKLDYNLAIWSSAGDDYVEEIIRQTRLNKYEFKFVWGRSKATYRINFEQDDFQDYRADYSHYHYVKPLKKVKKLGYKIERILIVDDSPHKSKLNYGNAIYPKSYVGDVEDDELLRLSKYLSSIKDCENFRKIEKRNWRTQHNN